VDYVFGVEVGMDTNARKNRNGTVMEQTVAGILQQAGLNFQEQVSCSNYPALKAALGADEKRFDFAFSAKGTTYLAETNFYTSGGSKLNEVARAYSELSPIVNAVSGFQFVWITDGIGWNSAKNKLEEAFRVVPHIYNLTTFPLFLDSLKK